MASRFGLDPDALRTGSQAANSGPEGANGLPTCTNCRTGNCNRCPTAITMHGRSGWSSDFECAHYHADPDHHQDLVEQDDEEHYSGDWHGGSYG